MACVISVTPEQRVVRLQRERKARTTWQPAHRDGVVEDKLGQLLLVSGKLSFLEALINSHAGASSTR